MSKRILVSGLGFGGLARETSYCLADDETNQSYGKVKMATVALIHLLHKVRQIPYPKLVILLGTKQSEEIYRYLEDELAPLGIELKLIPYSLGLTKEELRHTVVELLNEIPPKCYLTVDLTHGLRHLPFLFFVAIQYLTVLRPKAEIDGVYYAMFRQGERVNPIVNLKLLLEFMEWIYAIRVFKDTRVAANLSHCLAHITEDKDTKQVRKLLDDFSRGFSLALPLQMGTSAAGLKDCLDDISGAIADEVLLGKELFGEIRTLASEFAFDQDNVLDQPLKEPELDRQARIIDSYLATGQLSSGIGLIREWMVSAYMLHNNRAPAWRGKDRRQIIPSQLGNLAAEDYEVGLAWGKVRDWRNELAHHGMEKTAPAEIDIDIRDIKTQWNTLKKASPIVNFGAETKNKRGKLR
ncbi:MAG: CRISPR-associated DxTHG motif protein [Firmicutes bacterium]|nr:CRISPR-associated DxTHG motif protein [Bacillota bacterium]